MNPNDPEIDGYMNILIVDDKALNVALYERLMEHEGHKVRTAGAGKEALTILTSVHDIDACLVDLNMPEMDGVELYRAYKTFAKEGKARKDIPFVLVSGASDVVRFKEARNEGFADVLVKPPDMERLRAFLESLESNEGSKGRKNLLFVIHEHTVELDEIIKQILTAQDHQAAKTLTDYYTSAQKRIQNLLD
ncbi:response regulator [Candidatus Neomarinimicrobiota bacterium]